MQYELKYLQESINSFDCKLNGVVQLLHFQAAASSRQLANASRGAGRGGA